MTLWQRFRTAFTLVVVLSFCIAIADMFLRFDAIPWLLSPVFVLPAFSVGCLVAPVIHRLLPWGRKADSDV